MELFSVAEGCGNRSNSHDTTPATDATPALPSSIPSSIYGERRKVEHDGINERGIKRESDKGVEPCLCWVARERGRRAQGSTAMNSSFLFETLSWSARW